MESIFSGMTLLLDNTRVKLVFPTKLNKETVKPQEKVSASQHIHYDIEIHFVLAGSYRLTAQDSEQLLETDSVCIIPKGCRHRLSPVAEPNDIFNVLVSLQAKGTGSKAKAVTQLWNGIRETQVLNGCHRICQHVRDFCVACKKSGDINEQIKKSLMTLAFCLVTEQLSARFPCRSRVAEVCRIPYDGSFFDAELENFLMCNYTRKLSREDAAKQIGISPAQLSRIIKRNYGTNYTQLMTSLRMVDAKKLLQSEKTITQIAKSLGYTTYNGFAAAFKRHYGTTPESMRNGGK